MGGIGAYFGEINGMTSAARWMKLFDQQAQVVSQGFVRRGASAFYTPLDHPDMLDIFNAKDVHAAGDQRFKIDSNIAVCVSDEVMKKYFQGDAETKKLISKTLKMRLKYGSPYITFTGNANRHRPQWYVDRKMEIKHSQLCLLPFEKVLVKGRDGSIEGVPIGKLAQVNSRGRSVTVFDGKSWVETTSFKPRGTEKRFLEIELNGLTKFYTTFDHTHVIEGTGERVKAKDLKINQLLLHHSLNKRCTGLRITHIKEIGWQDIKNAKDESIFDEPPMTYCPTIPSTGLFALANGAVTGNCNEIYQYSDIDHSYICVLSSLNVAKYDEWKDAYFSDHSVPEWAIFFLDAVVEELISRLCIPDALPWIPSMFSNDADYYASQFAKPGLEKALRSTIKGRALGLGTLGYHAYLMSKGIPFESEEARDLNIEIHKNVGYSSLVASEYLAEWLGECPWCEGYGYRNSQLNAIAPTTTNSILCGGITPGIEPIAGNIYEKVGAKTTAVRKNPYLEKLLEGKGQNTAEVWNKISSDQGSVKSLDFLSDYEKLIFKTFREIDPGEIIKQAADRQPFIFWQGQSLNLYYAHDTSAKKIVKDFLDAYRLGLKGLYYVRSNTKNQNSNKEGEVPVHIKTRTDCVFCSMTKQLLTSYGIPYSEEYKSTGRVPEITYFGRELEGGYEELAKILTPNNSLRATEEDSSCLACEG